jgi:uncharacterized membrane-anchored protein
MAVSKIRLLKGQSPLLVALAWLVCVVVVSFLPDSVKSAFHTKGSLHSWDHLCAFAVGGAALLQASRQRIGQIGLLLFGLATGFTIEVAQHLVYHADVELMDMLMDAVGIGVGALAMVLWKSRDLHTMRSSASRSRLASGDSPRPRR